MRISLVVAASRNRVIGVAGGLPWHIPSDLKRFKALTMGHPCLMGRRTWDTLGRPLPGRDMIVVSRGAAIATAGVHTVHSLEEGLALASTLAAARGVAEIMVIGGGDLYRQSLPLAARVHYTEVDAVVTGDTTFPKLDPSEWHEASSEAVRPAPGDDHGYTLRVFDRVS